MGGNLACDYKLHVSLDKMQYSPGELVNGTFSFDFSGDPYKKKNLKIKNPAVVLSIIQTETIQERSQPKKKQNIAITQAININDLLNISKNPDAIFPFQLQIPLNAQPSFEYPHQEY